MVEERLIVNKKAKGCVIERWIGRMEREYPSLPLIGVGALVMRGDEFLLVKRMHEPSKGLWSIPGGLVDLGEAVEEAARREVEEETGVKIELERLLDVIDNIIRDANGKVRYHYVLVDYLARPLTGEVKASSDVLEARWVKASDLAKYEVTKTLRRLLNRVGVSM